MREGVNPRFARFWVALANRGLFRAILVSRQLANRRFPGPLPQRRCSSGRDLSNRTQLPGVSTTARFDADCSRVDADGNFDLRKAKSAFKNGRGIGRVGRSSEAGEGRDARGTAELTNAFRDSFSRTHGWGFP